MVGAIFQAHELGKQLSSFAKDGLNEHPAFYDSMLKELSAGAQIQLIDGNENTEAADNSDSLHKGNRESVNTPSDTLDTLARLHASGCIRLLDATFAHWGTDPIYVTDQSSEFKAKMKVVVAEVLSRLDTESRDHVIRYFCDDAGYDETIDDERLLTALRKLRHPTRSEGLRALALDE